jgi:hypothetical protein
MNGQSQIVRGENTKIAAMARQRAGLAIFESPLRRNRKGRE